MNRRLSRLSNDTNYLLRLAAGSHRWVRAGAAGPSRNSGEPLLDCLDEAIKAGLLRVVDGAPPSYDFAHAMSAATPFTVS